MKAKCLHLAKKNILGFPEIKNTLQVLMDANIIYSWQNSTWKNHEFCCMIYPIKRWAYENISVWSLDSNCYLDKNCKKEFFFRFASESELSSKNVSQDAGVHSVKFCDVSNLFLYLIYEIMGFMKICRFCWFRWTLHTYLP